MKNYKAAWPKWLMDAVTPEVETELNLRLGDVRWGDVRLGDVRLGDLRWGDVRLGDVRWGDLRWGDVRLGDVRWGDVRLGDVRWGDVRWGDVRWGDVRWGDVRWGDVRWGDVRLGDVRWGDVRWGDVRWGDVRWGDVIWQDYFDVLWRAPHEVAGLIGALKAGKVNGRTYEGECACLCGTIAKLKHCNYQNIPGITPDSSRPIERFFLAINTGDTPENNPWSVAAVRWAEIFQELSVKHGA